MVPKQIWINVRAVVENDTRASTVIQRCESADAVACHSVWLFTVQFFSHFARHKHVLADAPALIRAHLLRLRVTFLWAWFAERANENSWTENGHARNLNLT